MSLRTRTFLVVVAALLGLILVSQAVSWTILHTSFSRFESRIALRNLDRVIRTLGREIAGIKSTARDWSAWDDTYAYMRDRNPAYVTENLTPGVLQNLRLSFMVFLDESGDPVYGETLDRLSGAGGVPDEDLLKLLKRALESSQNAAGEFAGFLELPQGIALVVGSPILRTNSEGPARGTIAVGRILTEAEIAEIGDVSTLKLTLHRQGDRMPADLADVLPGLKDGVRHTRALGPQFLAAYGTIPDLFGKPTILVRVVLPREAYEFRQRTWLFLLGMLLLVGAVVTGTAMLVLERQVLARLTGLSRRVNDIAAGRAASSRVDVDRHNDELTSLAVEINRMLDALARSREDLRRSEAVARALLDAPNDPAILLDPQGTVLGLNRHAAGFVQPGFPVGAGSDKMHAAGVHALRPEHLREVVEKRQPVCFEAEAGGRHLSHNLYPITNEAGEVVQIATYLRDVTAQKQAIQALEESERRYRSFVENSHGIVFQVRADGALELCEGNLYAITGYTEAEFLSGNTQWNRIVHPDDAYVLEGGWGGLLQVPDRSSHKQYRIVRKNGEVRWVQEFVQSVAGPDGRVACIQGVIYDITERVETKEALGVSLQATADLVRALPTGLLVYRYEPPDRLILLDGNPEAERLTGVPLGECRGRDLGEIWPGLKDSEIFHAYLNAVRTGEVVKREEFHYVDDRLEGVFDLCAFRLPGNKLVVAFESIRERKEAESERRRLEEQLHHAQKMEAVGQLAGGVAHDFNNLLSGILGYASLLKLEAPDNTSVYEAARTIEQAAERAADLTRQLLGFARRGKFQNVAVNLHDTVQEVIRLLGRTFDKNIRIVQRFDCERPLVTGDPNQLQQVFVNLALNARDAMPEGGDLTFESGIVEARDMSDLDLLPDGRSYVTVAVTDEGCGIPKEHLNRLFEPFFTTKEPGKGTGMGLAMVYGIVRNHGGFVRVYSEHGRGATFRVYLPLAESVSPAESRDGSLSDEAVRGSARILLVDDEAVVRNMGSTVLSRLGYTVVTACDGLEAADYYREHAGEIDLAIIDMVMPEMGGQECFRALKAINPGVRAILSSGYGFNGKASELLEEGMLGFIQKPYRVSELSMVVAKALAASRTP